VKKPKKDTIREDRIHNQAIMDAYGPEEQAMSWYHYLDDKIRFPFHAKCIAPKVVSPLRKGDTVEVWHIARGKRLLRRHARANPLART